VLKTDDGRSAAARCIAAESIFCKLMGVPPTVPGTAGVLTLAGVPGIEKQEKT
jgi:hypothetical protein